MTTATTADCGEAHLHTYARDQTTRRLAAPEIRPGVWHVRATVLLTPAVVTLTAATPSREKRDA